jgi:hypothetical protein
MTPVLNKLLTVQLLIQKRTVGIIFDNDANGCYNIIISGIVLAVLRRIGYSNNSVNILRRLWAELENHICTGYGVSDKTYKSAIDKLLYGIGKVRCVSLIIWVLLNQLLVTALGDNFDCIQLVDIEGTTHTRQSDSFVDDMTTGATKNDVKSLPVDSCEKGLAKEEDKLVVKMETIIQFFLDSLEVTGGDLAPRKCAWYLISHRWEDGIPRRLCPNPTHRGIEIVSKSMGTTVEKSERHQRRDTAPSVST